MGKFAHPSPKQLAIAQTTGESLGSREKVQSQRCPVRFILFCHTGGIHIAYMRVLLKYLSWLAKMKSSEIEGRNRLIRGRWPCHIYLQAADHCRLPRGGADGGVL